MSRGAPPVDRLVGPVRVAPLRRGRGGAPAPALVLLGQQPPLGPPLVAVREVLRRRGPDAAAALALGWVAGDGTTEVIAEGRALAVLAQPPAG